MPTGYTAGVHDGTVTEFRDFALQCARAFGALILMRDDPMDAPIPDEFQPSDYNAECAKEYRDELLAVEAMTDEESEAAALAAFEKACAEQTKRHREAGERRARYEAMLEQVSEWQPPTDDHQGLKDFMAQQLNESIRFDCRDGNDDLPRRLTGAEWRAQRIAILNQNVQYSERAYADELKRTQERNDWVRKLRESLQEPAESK